MPLRTFALLALSPLALCACHPLCACPLHLAPDGGALSTPVGLPGQLEVVTIPFPSRSVNNRVEFATSAEVTLVDPNNVPVTANVDPLPTQGDTPLRLSFVPELPGPYHLTVGFQPNFGVTQADVQIATDRTDAGVTVRPMPVECRRFESAGGVDFCLDADAGQLVTVVGGQAVSRVEARVFARAPALSGVWVVAGGGSTDNWVRLYALDAGELALSFEQQLPGASAPCSTCPMVLTDPALATLKARENRLLWFDWPQLVELTFDGGELGVNDLAASAGFERPPFIAVQWGPFGSVAAESPGTPVSGPGDMVCVLPWDGGACARLGGFSLAADDQVLWSYAPETRQLAAFGLPLDGGPPEEAQLPVTGPDGPPFGPIQFYWSTGGDTAVARFENGQLSLEAFALPLAGAARSGVDPSRIWRWDPDDGGVIHYVDR